MLAGVRLNRKIFAREGGCAEADRSSECSQVVEAKLKAYFYF